MPNTNAKLYNPHLTHSDREFLNKQLVNACIRNSHISTIKRLIKDGADVNSRDDSNSTPLMDASIYSNNNDVIQLLLEYGADVNARNIRNNTALMMACGYNSNPEIIRTLLENGADITIRNKGNYTAWKFLKKNSRLSNISDLEPYLKVV